MQTMAVLKYVNLRAWFTYKYIYLQQLNIAQMSGYIIHNAENRLDARRLFNFRYSIDRHTILSVMFQYVLCLCCVNTF